MPQGDPQGAPLAALLATLSMLYVSLVDPPSLVTSIYAFDTGGATASRPTWPSIH